MKPINTIKGKKGTILPRDVIFMIFIFSGIIAFASILVTEMGNEYGNTNMTDSYNQEEIGSSALISEGDKWEGIADDLSGDNGLIKMLGGALTAIGVILLEVLKAPNTFSHMLTSTLEIVGASDEFQNMAGYVLSGLLYIVIIFGIAKVFLRGGDI